MNKMLAASIAWLTAAGCGGVGSGPVAPGCGSNSLTATIAGQTITPLCYVAALKQVNGMSLLDLSGSALSPPAAIAINIFSTDGFAGLSSGSTVVIAGKGGSGASVVVGGDDTSGQLFSLAASSGSVVLNQWSTSTGATISMTIPDAAPLTISVDTTKTGTVSGTASAMLMLEQ